MRARGRILGISILLLLLCGGALSTAWGTGLEDLPEVGAVVGARMPLPCTGVRGLLLQRDGVILLATENTGLSAPDTSYQVRLLKWRSSELKLQVLSRQRDEFETGLVGDGEAWWSSGSLIGKSSAIYRISPVDGSVLSSLPSPGYHPGGIAFDGLYLWVVDCDGRNILRVETEEGRVSKKVSAPGFYPTGLAFDGSSFWSADASTGRIYRLDGSTGRGNGVIVRDAFDRPGEFVSLSWDGTGLWTVAASDSEAVRLDILR